MTSKRVYLVPLASLGMLMFGMHHVMSAAKSYETVPPPATPIRVRLNAAVAATGMVEPQSENISVGSALAGVVAEVFVGADRCGEKVYRGDPLFRIDDRHLQSQLRMLKAQVEVPRAELARLEQLPRREEVPPVEHRIEAARAKVSRCRDAYSRAQRLLPTGAATEAEVVQSREALAESEAELAAAEAELQLLKGGAWEPDRMIVEARVRHMEAQIAELETEIERSLVRAPVDGIVLQVNVRPGQYVAAPAGSDLLVIGDMREPRVRVEIDERDIPRFDSAAPAQAVVRGGDEMVVPLKFVRIEPYVVPKKVLSGIGNERVDTRVLQVLYSIEDLSSASLYVGQQVDVFVGS